MLYKCTQRMRSLCIEKHRAHAMYACETQPVREGSDPSRCCSKWGPCASQPGAAMTTSSCFYPLAMWAMCCPMVLLFNKPEICLLM